MRQIRVPKHVHIAAYKARQCRSDGNQDILKLVSTYDRVMDKLDHENYSDLNLDIDIKFMENLIAKIKKSYWLLACV